NRFIVLPIIPNAFKCTEGAGMLREICRCPSVCLRAFDPIVPEVRKGLRRQHDEQRGHSYGQHVTEALSLTMRFASFGTWTDQPLRNTGHSSVLRYPYFVLEDRTLCRKFVGKYESVHTRQNLVPRQLRTALVRRVVER